MLCATKYFGEIEYDETAVITFEEGIPGFLDVKRFVLLADEAVAEENDLFFWLQCVDNGDVAFALMDVLQIMPDYDPQIAPDWYADLGEPEQVGIYNIVVIPEDLQEMRVNLKAPLLIGDRRGRQVVAGNEAYQIRHNVMEELEKARADAATSEVV